MTTPMHPVSSSQISYIGYDEDTNTLYVTFKNGSTFKYEDVPKSKYDKLLNSSSIGSYFIKNIKNNYSYSKIN